MKKYVIIFVSAIVCLLIGFSAESFQYDAIHNWYVDLNKSVLTPPAFVFPLVWTILYILIGISLAYLIIKKPLEKKLLLLLWIIQMFFNFLWSILFFYYQNPLLGLIDLLLLDIVVINYIIIGLRQAKVSAILFIPYIIWLMLATYLNAYIFVNN